MNVLPHKEGRMSRLFVVRLLAVQVLLFLLNESVVISVGRPVYGVMRMAVIPLLSVVVIIAGIFDLVRAPRTAPVQATAAGAILASLVVWAFQWLWPGALFGWFIDRMK
jgi:hypothetical protein